MKVLHISDIHYRREYEKCKEGYKGVLYKMQNPLIPLDFCLDKALQKNPDVIVITGDLSEDGTVEDYQLLRQHIEEKVGNIPIVVTLGNHDNKMNFLKGWLKEDGVISFYNTVKQVGDTVIVSWDNSIQGNPNGVIEYDQIAWLKKTLKQYKGKQIILITHHHFLKHQASVPEVECEEKVFSIMKENGVDCILCGHSHHKYSGMAWDIPYYTGDGMSFYGDNLQDGSVRFQEKYGYSLYTIEDGIVKEHEAHTYENGNILDTLIWK